MGLQNLTFNSGLLYAKMMQMCPEEISCWHFISLLEGHPNNMLSPQSLSTPQVAQILINFQTCFVQIFANGRDYPTLPDIHQSPATWCGTFHGGLLRAFNHLLTGNTVTAWAEHCWGPPGQGLHLTTGFFHYMGLLIWLFQDWLIIVECDAEYCQPFIAYDQSDPSRQSQKTGHILATNQSAMQSFKTEFDKWATNLHQILSHQSINSFSYHFEEVFSYGPPGFVLQKPVRPKINLKQPYQPTPPIPEDSCCAHGGPLAVFSPPVVQHQPPQNPPQPPPLPPAHPAPAPTLDCQGGISLPLSGKSSTAVPLFCWSGISGQTNLPNILKAWHAAAPL